MSALLWLLLAVASPIAANRLARRVQRATVRRLRAQLLDARIDAACAATGRAYWRERYEVERTISHALLHILAVEGIAVEVSSSRSLTDLSEFTHEDRVPLVDESHESHGGER